jgi:glycogen(starch) synthase
VREIVDGFELPVEKVHLVPNGVDPDLWSAPDAADVPREKLVIAGRGSYLPELQTQIDVEGVGDLVELAGFVADDELRATLRRAGCVVIPSLYEPFGIVALEGMAAGAPTIVARTGGLAEIVEGTGAGLLFEPGNHNDLAGRIEQVLTDPRLAALMHDEAAALLQALYTWDAIAVSTLAVYETACAGALAGSVPPV